MAICFFLMEISFFINGNWFFMPIFYLCLFPFYEWIITFLFIDIYFWINGICIFIEICFVINFFSQRSVFSGKIQFKPLELTCDEKKT